ncbi:hypothetical protein SAMN05216357_1106 [Porphyromonadaceae bacterium KH3CP3RA]|nr:hypothetical protein SAMN05216357_1106 [Porphyromonadaceae bacterium KH3CP3RA]
MRIFVLFNTVRNYIALFWSYIRIRKIQTKRPKNGSALSNKGVDIVLFSWKGPCGAWM